MTLQWIMCHSDWTLIPPCPPTSVLSYCPAPRPYDLHSYFSLIFQTTRLYFLFKVLLQGTIMGERHSQNAQKNVKQIKKERKRVRKENWEYKYFLDPSILKLEKPQCFSKYHIQLLIFKKTLAAPLVHRKGGKRCRWLQELHPGRVEARALRLRLFSYSRKY